MNFEGTFQNECIHLYWESGSVLEYCTLKLLRERVGVKPYANPFSESNFVQNPSLCWEVNRMRLNFQADHKYATRDAEIKGLQTERRVNCGPH